MIEERVARRKCPKCGGQIIMKVEVLSVEESQKMREAANAFKDAFPNAKLKAQQTEKPIEFCKGFYCSGCKRTYKDKEALKPQPEDIRSRCFVCKKKTIVEDFEEVFDATHGPQIIGPGGDGQWQMKSRGFHCEFCGIKYEFRPPKPPAKKK